MGRCKHQTGVFQELSQAFQVRNMVAGQLDPESVEWWEGNITGYVYKCSACSKVFEYGSSGQKGLPRWLVALHLAAYGEKDEK